MIIFIRKIPADTKLSEVIAFVEPALKGRLFRKGGVIKGAKILVLRDKRLNAIEFHGLVTVELDKVALRAIKDLKGRRFKGKFVVVRQYYQRNWHNDPRQNRAAAQAADSIERRVSDRRRGKDLEIIEDISSKFSSEGDFFRKSL